jgi:hypothetical protein
MKEECDNPLSFIKMLKEMINESTTPSELYGEIDMEPKPLRKWFAKHL